MDYSNYRQKVVTVVFFLIFNLSLGAEIFPFCLGYKTLYGYLDNDLNVVIPPKYEYAGDIIGGYAIAKVKGNEAVLIDEQGNEIFRYTDENIFGFGHLNGEMNHESFTFKKDGLYGLMDTDGNILEYGYRYISPYTEDVARVANVGEETFFIDRGGNKLFRRCFLFDPPFLPGGSFYNGFARVYIIDDDKKYYGLIDKKGKYVIEPKFEDMGFNSYGLYMDRNENSEMYDFNFFGFHSGEGEWVIPPVYYGAYDFSGKVAAVMYKEPVYDMENPFWQLVDRNGNIVKVLDEDIEICTKFSDGLAVFKRLGPGKGLYGFIDEYGEIVIEDIFDSYFGLFNNGYANIVFNGKRGLVDRNGNIFFFTDILK